MYLEIKVCSTCFNVIKGDSSEHLCPKIKEEGASA